MLPPLGPIELFQEYDWIIDWAAVKQRHWFRMDPDEIRQVAALALLEAAVRYRPEDGDFVCFAKHVVIKAEKEARCKEASIIGMPLRYFWRAIRLRDFGRSWLRKKLPQSKHSRRRVLHSIRKAKRFLSMKPLVRQTLRQARLRPEHANNPPREMERREAADLLLAAIRHLEPREADLLKMRYGIGCPEHTLEDLAQLYGLTRERIRQRQVRAEQKLRVVFTGEPLARQEHSRRKWLSQIAGEAWYCRVTVADIGALKGTRRQQLEGEAN